MNEMLLSCLCLLVATIHSSHSLYRDDIPLNRLQLLELQRQRPPQSPVLFPRPSPLPTPPVPAPKLPSHYENSKFQQIVFRAHSPYRQNEQSKRLVKFPNDDEEDNDKEERNDYRQDERETGNQRQRLLEDEQIYQNALASADILVPPFGDRPNDISDERNRHYVDFAAAAYAQLKRPSIFERATGSPRPSDALPLLPFATQLELNGGIQYAPQYNDGPRRPALEYGSPFPYGGDRQSNQLAYAPARPQQGLLRAPPIPVPFPPSFISITTNRPELGGPPPVIRTGDSYDYDAQHVPDPFLYRRSKSLLDSYIPSWEIAKMWQLQRDLEYSRAFKRYAKREVQKDNGVKKEKEESAKNSKGTKETNGNSTNRVAVKEDTVMLV